MNQYVIVVGDAHRIAGPYTDQSEAEEAASGFGDLGYSASVHPLLTVAEMRHFLFEEGEPRRQTP